MILNSISVRSVRDRPVANCSVVCCVAVGGDETAVVVVVDCCDLYVRSGSLLCEVCDDGDCVRLVEGEPVERASDVVPKVNHHSLRSLDLLFLFLLSSSLHHHHPQKSTAKKGRVDFDDERKARSHSFSRTPPVPLQRHLPGQKYPW